MESNNDKKRTKVEDDRLSSLPNEIIHKILSFVDLKKAVETSVLSSRWRFIWASMPYLKFSSDDFTYHFPKFIDFVTNFLSHRNNQVEVFSLKFCFCGDVTEKYVKQVMDYAFSHNIQQLDVVCFLEHDKYFPLSLFSSTSLKHLSLTKEIYWGSLCKTYSLKVTSMWDLPALTTLHLEGVTLYNDDCISTFSKCADLKNLTLRKCETTGNRYSIFHPGVSNLTLENPEDCVTVVNVVAPQLKNLTINNSSREHQFMISAPDLAYLRYKGYRPLQLLTNGFHSLEGADLCISSRYTENAHEIVRLLQQLQSVKFLTLNLELIKLLSSSVELISNQPSPFANLKRLKIYPESVSSREYLDEKVNMSTEVEKYLLASSRNATLTMITHKDIRAIRNANLARKRMRELQVLLEEYKASCESHNIKMHTQLETEKQSNIDGMIKQIDKYWGKLNAQMEQGKKNTSSVISILKIIEGLMTNLPQSQTVNLQTRFSSLCREADLTMKKIIGHTKIEMD